MTHPVSLVGAAFVDHLRDMSARSGTWVSVYLPLVQGGDDGEVDQVTAIEWKNAVGGLRRTRCGRRVDRGRHVSVFGC